MSSSPVSVCTNPQHDHSEEDGTSLACVDCGQPMHYDEACERYQHDGQEAHDCFLVKAAADASPCMSAAGQ